MTSSTRKHASYLAIDIAWILVWGLLSSAWCVTAAQQLGATFDEPFYLDGGLEHWRTGSCGTLLRKGTMPLPVDVETLPLHIWESWCGTHFDVNQEFHRLLPVARAGNLVFWWLLLIYGFLVARSIVGNWGARLAVALLACEPNLLAHASLATTDIAITACLLALVYHFRQGRQRAWWLRVGVPTIWFAAALLAKVSGMVFGPICLFVIEAERLYRMGAFRRQSQVATSAGAAASGWWSALTGYVGCFRPFMKDFWQIWLLGFLLVFVYCGSDWETEPSFIEWAQQLPAGSLRDCMLWTSEHLCIFSNAGEAVVQQVKHGIRGHDAFLLGSSYRRSVWFYFPVALTMKLVTPVLLLPILLAALRRKSLSNWVLWAALALLIFSLNCKVQIGIRLVLPLVALLLVGLAVAIVNAASQSDRWRRLLFQASGAAAVVWMLVASWSVWPNGLCYINEVWGGPTGGYQLLSDSNYDWGQGLMELQEWSDSQELDQLSIWYFGMDPAANQVPFRRAHLHSVDLERPEDVLTHVQGDYLAVGTTLLYGSYSLDKNHRFRHAAEFLQRYRPVARTSTFLIYDFRDEQHSPRVARED